MKQLRIGTVAMFLLWAAFLGADDAKISATIEFEPARTFAGIAPRVRYVFHNEGGTAVVLPERVLLRVSRDGGEPFLARYGYLSVNGQLSLPGAEQVVAPRSTHERVLYSRGLTDRPGWFNDPRMNVPGTYRIQALFVDSFAEEKLWHVPALQAESAIPVRFSSGEATLTIEKPAGEDGELWERMLQSARRKTSEGWAPGGYWPDQLEFITEVVEQHPRSIYAPYAISSYQSTSIAKRLEMTRRIFEAHPSAPNRDYIEFLITAGELDLAGERMSAPSASSNIDSVKDLLSRVEAGYAALKEQTRDRQISELCEKGLEQVGRLRQLIRERAPDASAK